MQIVICLDKGDITTQWMGNNFAVQLASAVNVTITLTPEAADELIKDIHHLNGERSESKVAASIRIEPEQANSLMTVCTDWAEMMVDSFACSDCSQSGRMCTGKHWQQYCAIADRRDKILNEINGFD